jgi:hypothetical protein
MNYLTKHALELLKSDEGQPYLDDAREGAAVGNTVIGSLMSITLGSPRWATEKAGCEALAVLDSDDD